ncbi:uncharacterized protein NDAI_0B05850 [Naumovozyma dairenensis CBS 421]|uniref:Uncharacterized protein n=1 Tax=Naumovozyma dairenensis (strain ATCC 10597 / BCRC 20456 / CBS 421 / NBRC 0211 / NRRL Y-12639) TaxID=1071378 RepID=G0W757_NAUDC|nr:hypothetical protein NDAI_0B05850 [Naumovozyma dairenensis CBS 421]CCD23618.1 hypothetical protein NDAI_0B05850 [Naumovozyma dairenensis CBS 421]
MFSSFSLDKITNSIGNAAQKATNTLNNAINTATDPQTKLSIKSQTRLFQEQLGTIHDISKLPDQYKSLELKTDSLEKSIKRILLVSKTFEMEGYDYPPNLTESFSDWWNITKKSSSHRKKQISVNNKKKNNTDNDHDNATNVEPIENDITSSSFLPRSFAQAISKSAMDCTDIYQQLSIQETATKETTIKDENEAQEEDDEDAGEEEEEDDDDDEDIQNLIKAFESWSNCYKNIDQGKSEMDSMMTKEFNNKLEDLINNEFKKVNTLRKKVADSRLKFDTVRHEIKIKEEEQDQKEKQAQAQAQAQAQEQEQEQEQGEKAKKEQEEEQEQAQLGDNVIEESKKKEEVIKDEKKKPEIKSGTETTSKQLETEAEPKAEVEAKVNDTSKDQLKKEDDAEKQDEQDDSEEHKLLEQLEDEFVSSTASAVEMMTEITESSSIIGLIKLFQNFQLVYYRQCVQEIEANLKTLNELDHA